MNQRTLREDWREPRDWRRPWRERPGFFQGNATCDCHCSSAAPSSPSSALPTYTCTCAGNPLTLPTNLTLTMHASTCPGLDGQTVTLTADDQADNNLNVWKACLSSSAHATLWRGDTTLCGNWACSFIFGCDTQNICTISTSPANTDFRHFGLIATIVQPLGGMAFSCFSLPSCGHPSPIWMSGCACANSTCSPFVILFGAQAGCSNGSTMLIETNGAAGFCKPCCNLAGAGGFDTLSFTVTE